MERIFICGILERGAIMENRIVTYWRKIGSNEVYKYYGQSRPHNVENYRQVSEWEYRHSVGMA